MNPRHPSLGKKFTFADVPESLGYPDIDEMKPGIVYVSQFEERIDLLCPCGCGDRITLSTVNNARPRWRVFYNNISPSIQRTIGCLSHFTITAGITL